MIRPSLTTIVAWLLSTAAVFGAEQTGAQSFYEPSQSAPPATRDSRIIYRGQSPGDFGGSAVKPVTPWDNGQPSSYSQPVAPVSPSAPPLYSASPTGVPTATGSPPVAGVWAPPANAVAPPGTAPAQGIQPTYPPNNVMTNNSPWQSYQPATLPPDGVRTAYAGPLPAPGVYDSEQKIYPGDLLNTEGQPGPAATYPPLDLENYVFETQTGKLMFGVGVNSDAGVIGNIVLDEQNFDWRRWPNSFEEIRNGTAWRGAGQRFRIEAAPGSTVQRYVVSFTEPYLFDTPVSLRLSGSYFTRAYTDWTEQRAGGRVGLGYLFTPDLSGSFSFRGEKVDISNPSNPTVPALNAVLGQNDLFGFGLSAAHDTRDSAFLPTEGHYVEIGGEYVIGTWQYPRANIDARQYYTLTERADGSGRHVLGLSGRFGYSGTDTPLYDNYFAGGFSTIRGFNYRGASPRDQNVIIGGPFELLGSAEYLFPITADDMLRGVIFCDFGTVEQSVKFDADTFRVTLGAGLRIVIPAMGQAPIALDIGVPVHWAPGDEINNFNFFIGFNR